MRSVKESDEEISNVIYISDSKINKRSFTKISRIINLNISSLENVFAVAYASLLIYPFQQFVELSVFRSGSSVGSLLDQISD